MNLRSVSLPPDRERWPAWIEQQLVRPDLGQLAAELETLVGRPSDAAPSLEQLIGDNKAAVLSSGVSSLNPQQIAQLIRHPRLLLRLQELVLADGGEYWTQVFEADDRPSQVLRQWQAIKASLTETATPPAAGVTEARIAAGSNQLDTPPTRRLRFLGSLVAVAAVCVIGGSLWLSRPEVSGWGFDRPGVLTAELDSQKFLYELSLAAEEWYERRAADASDLEQRLVEFRHGCESLQQSPLAPLAAADQAWLRERCRAWTEKLDGHLADLRSGRDTQEIRLAADDTVTKMINALRNRAAAS